MHARASHGLSRSSCRALSDSEVHWEKAEARHREEAEVRRQEEAEVRRREEAGARHREEAEVRRQEEAGARHREDAEAMSWVSSQLPHWRVSRMGGRDADDSSGQ